MRILDPICYAYLPDHLREGVERWIEQGITPGSFLRAVIRNDLAQAVLRADDTSLASLPSIMRWFIEWGPNGSYGSDKVFSQWPMYLKALERQEASNG